MKGLLDCGTTNTKFYLLEDGKILLEEYENQGIKNFVAAADKTLLKRMIGEVIVRAVEKAGVELAQLDTVVAFGMITSEIGLIELPHQEAPAGVCDLQKSLFILEQQDILPSNTRFVFIRGVRLKNGDLQKPETVLECDFMRGEETQCIGITALYQPTLPVNILFLSSHSKMVYINRQGQIEKSITTPSGQLFEALSRHTILEKSIACKDDQADEATLREMLMLAERCLAQDGFLRAILIPRFMEVFTDRTPLERRIFLEAVIALEDYKAFERYFREGNCWTQDYYILGQKLRGKLYKILLKEKLGQDISVIQLVGKEAVKQVTVAGAMQIVNSKIWEENACVTK